MICGLDCRLLHYLCLTYVGTGTGLVGAPACGDVMKLQFEVDDAGKIIDAKFKTFGCGSAIGRNSITHHCIHFNDNTILRTYSFVICCY